MSTIATRGWMTRLVLKCTWVITAFVSGISLGSAQTATLSPVGFPVVCEGENITLNLNITGYPDFYAWTLQHGGILGTVEDLTGDNEDLPATLLITPEIVGTFELVLIATDGPNEVSSLPLEIEVIPVTTGNLTLATLAAGVEEVPTQPTLFRYCSAASTDSVDMAFEVTWDGPDPDLGLVTIDWGDGDVSTGADIVDGVVSHKFGPGSSTITFTVINTDNPIVPCIGTSTFNVFVGTAPVINVGFASQTLCLNNPNVELILGNDSLTELTWSIQFTDGSPEVEFTTSQDDVSFLHTFTSSSCGETHPISDDAYFVLAKATNGCDFSTSFNGPFRVSEPPVLGVASNAGGVVCPEEPVLLSNVSIPPNLATGFGCTDDYDYLWELGPNVDLLSGDLGSTNGTPGQPELWSTGDEVIEVTSSVAGTHEIALIAYSNTACGADTTIFTLTIADPGVLSLDLPNQEVCSGVPVQDFTFDVAPDNYVITWNVLDADSNAVAPGQIPGINTVTGSGVDAVSPSDDWILTNTSSTSFTFLVEATVPCAASEPLIHAITVQPEPVITASPLTSTICSGDETNITMDINTGDAIVWDVNGAGPEGPGLTITDMWSNEALVPDTVNYTIYAAGAACEGDTVTVEVVVLPGIPEQPFADEVLCPGDSVEEIIFPDILGATYTWTNTEPQVGLGAGGQGDIPAWEAAENFTTEDFAGFVSVTGQVANCPVVEVGSYAVLVQAAPSIEVTPLSQTLCSGEVTDIEMSVNTGDDIVWDVDGAGPLGSGSAITDLLTNDGTVVETVLYEIYVLGSACPGDTVDVEVDVLPGLPALDLPEDQVLCPGDEFVGVDFPEVEGAVWSWINENPNNGLAETGQGDIAPWIAPANVTSDSLGGLVTITGQVASCPAEIAGSFLAVVDPTPVITATPLESTICSGLTTDIALSLNTNDTLFWTSVADPDIVEGDQFGSEVLILDQLFNTGEANAEIVYTIGILEVLEEKCPWDEVDVTVTVLPGLSPEEFDDEVLCPGDAVDAIELPDVEDVVWTWTNTEPATGLGAEGTGDIPSWVANENPLDESYVGTVTVLGQVPGCDEAAVGSYQIEVLPAPVIVATPADPVACSGEAIDVEIAFNGPGTAAWTADPVTDVSGIESPGAGVMITDTLVNVSSSIATVEYLVSVPFTAGTGCPGLPLLLAVEVLPQIPELTFLPDTLCPGESTEALTLPVLESVTWSWVNSNGAIGLDEQGDGVVPAWTATNPSAQDIAGDVTVLGHAGDCEAQPAGGYEVVVNATPQAEVVVSPDGNLSCIDSVAVIDWVMLSASTEVTSFTGGSILTEDIVLLGLDSAVVDSAATYEMILSNPLTGCEATQEIVVNPIDDISIVDVTTMNPLCFEEASGAIEIVTTEEDGEVTYDWDGPSPASSDLANDLLAGAYVVIVTNEAGCQDTASMELMDPEELIAEIVYSVKSECGEANGYLDANAAGGSGSLSYAWSNESGEVLASESLNIGGIDAGYYTFSAEDENGCVTDTTAYLDCIPLPEPIPTQFISPNGDDKNELWVIENMHYFPNAIVQVFNRWGTEVYYSEGQYLEEWNGTNKDGKLLPSATYFYVIDTKKKSQRPFNGYLELQTNQP